MTNEIMIEVEKSWPIKKDIFSGLQKIIDQITAKKDDYNSIASLNYEKGQEFISSVKRLSEEFRLSSFDQFHMENCKMTNAEIDAVFGVLD